MKGRRSPRPPPPPPPAAKRRGEATAPALPEVKFPLTGRLRGSCHQGQARGGSSESLCDRRRRRRRRPPLTASEPPQPAGNRPTPLFFYEAPQAAKPPACHDFFSQLRGRSLAGNAPGEATGAAPEGRARTRAFP